jgi:hypothetical protein
MRAAESFLIVSCLMVCTCALSTCARALPSFTNACGQTSQLDLPPLENCGRSEFAFEPRVAPGGPLERLRRDEIALEPLLMPVGDVLVRAVRGLHRGTPTTTETPRQMVVIGYSRRWPGNGDSHRPQRFNSVVSDATQPSMPRRRDVAYVCVLIFTSCTSSFCPAREHAPRRSPRTRKDCRHGPAGRRAPAHQAGAKTLFGLFAAQQASGETL